MSYQSNKSGYCNNDSNSCDYISSANYVSKSKPKKQGPGCTCNNIGPCKGTCRW